MSRVLVTGGCGFIGSNFIEYLLKSGEVQGIQSLVNVDKLTYAGQGRNLEHMGFKPGRDYTFYPTDICSPEIKEIFDIHRPDTVINFAAESHVDRSISDSSSFVRTNVFGAHNLLETSLKHGVQKFVQISTDEVYGSLSKDSPSSREVDPLHPRSPYAASKAGAEHFALSYYHTHGLPVVVTRSSNNFGRYQFPEKILPVFISNLMDGKKVPLMWSEENPGLNVRDWLHVEDNCRAIWFLSQKGEAGRAYNISGGNERMNIEVTRQILNLFGLGEDMIEKIPHRKGHDFRYSIDDSSLRDLGFVHRHGHSDFEKDLQETVKWYIKNESWWRPLKK